jgi:hypothetical protein
MLSVPFNQGPLDPLTLDLVFALQASAVLWSKGPLDEHHVQQPSLSSFSRCAQSFNRGDPRQNLC